MKEKAPKLSEVARQITSHLRGLEASPDTNPQDADGNSKTFYDPEAWVSGRYVGIHYIAYRSSGRYFLTRAQACEYLAYLRAGGRKYHLFSKD